MTTAAGPPSRPGVRVVVVDDTSHVRKVVGELLALDGFEVVGTAEDAESALEMVQSTRPHVVVMDLRMPGTDGLEATRRLRETCPEVQVVLYTAYVDGRIEREALRAGAALCLAKVEGLPRLGRELSRLTLSERGR